MANPLERAAAAARALVAAEGERAAFGAAAALFASAALGFASLALWIALARGVGPVGASLILAALYGALALGAGAVGRTRARRRRARAQAAKARLQAEALETLLAAGAASRVTGRAVGRVAPLAALAVGVWLGVRR